MKIAVPLLALALAGCALGQDRAVRNSQPYKVGYADGCAAATSAGSSYRHGPVTNEDAFRHNDAYRAGWNTGYSACRRTGNMPGTEPGQPVPEPSPGH